MGYRSIAIKTIILIIGLLSLIFTIHLQQWNYAEELLKKFIDFENGGLPGIIKALF